MSSRLHVPSPAVYNHGFTNYTYINVNEPFTITHYFGANRCYMKACFNVKKASVLVYILHLLLTSLQNDAIVNPVYDSTIIPEFANMVNNATYGQV